MLKSKLLTLLGAVLLVACGAEKTRAQDENKSNCLFDVIHPSKLSKNEILFFNESDDGYRWNGRLIYNDYYINIDSNICNLISLNIVMHRHNDFIDVNFLENFEVTLDEVKNASPFYESLPTLTEDDKINLLNTNVFEKEGLRVSIVETDSNSILIASWTSNTP